MDGFDDGQDYAESNFGFSAASEVRQYFEVGVEFIRSTFSIQMSSEDSGCTKTVRR